MNKSRATDQLIAEAGTTEGKYISPWDHLPLWVGPANNDDPKIPVEADGTYGSQALAEALKRLMEEYLGAYPDYHNKISFRTNGGPYSNTYGQAWVSRGHIGGEEDPKGAFVNFTITNENHQHCQFFVGLSTTEFMKGSRPLRWSNINENQFERLIYNLLETTEGIDDVQWVTQTKAPDSGKDISARRLLSVPLAPDRHERLLIQCKHRHGSSLNAPDINNMLGLISLAEPPKVDVLVVATSGTLTGQADALIENHNEAAKMPRIEKMMATMLESVILRDKELVNGLNLL